MARFSPEESRSILVADLERQPTSSDYSRELRAMIFNWRSFALFLHGTFGNIWRPFWLSQMGVGGGAKHLAGKGQECC